MKFLRDRELHVQLLLLLPLTMAAVSGPPKAPDQASSTTASIR